MDCGEGFLIHIHYGQWQVVTDEEECGSLSGFSTQVPRAVGYDP
jgi:hypothetical protein